MELDRVMHKIELQVNVDIDDDDEPIKEDPKKI
jgi:hypothetical protein